MLCVRAMIYGLYGLSQMVAMTRSMDFPLITLTFKMENFHHLHDK